MKPYVRRQHEMSCQDGCVLRGHQVVIPNNLRPQLLKKLHDDHIKIIHIKGLTKNYIWWPNLDKDIEGMSARCEDCKATVCQRLLTIHGNTLALLGTESISILESGREFISLS